MYGLNPMEREVVMSEMQRNRIRLEEATKLRWEELSKKAIRPTDEYHRRLFESVVHEEETEYKIDVAPGTPRRRRKIAKI